jgi:TRAP-type C4-dicarboxylate transport system substrate-binding protein
VSFAQVPAQLARGDIDAVLSSGDGGAGRKLWEQLPHFTAIDYAIPLSFTTLNLDHRATLDAATRSVVEAAAAATEARQWDALPGRLAGNYARMRAHGVTIATKVSRELRASLAAAAAAAVDAWCATAGAEARALVERR